MGIDQSALIEATDCTAVPATVFIEAGQSDG